MDVCVLVCLRAHRLCSTYDISQGQKAIRYTYIKYTFIYIINYHYVIIYNHYVLHTTIHYIVDIVLHYYVLQFVQPHALV